MKTMFPPIEVPRRPLPYMVDVFMAGSIEMGLAKNWQPDATAAIESLEPVRHILNPRRDDWDSTQPQRRDNPYFAGQVNWELDGIEMVDVVYMHFDQNTKSPISLAELGYVLGMRRAQMALLGASEARTAMTGLVVSCPDEFWRSGNVGVMCQRAGIPVYVDFDESLKALQVEIWKKHLHKSNLYGYVPFQTPWESQSDTKRFEGIVRGSKRVYS